MTPQEREEKKKAFLITFKELGYKNKTCDKLGLEYSLPTYWAKADAKWAMDYDLLKSYWKDKRKEELDIMLYDTAKTNSKGFMHMMAWFRSNGFDEYNPKSIVKKEDAKTEGALKKLIERLDSYNKGEKNERGRT